jgi:hypothetical protein
MEGLSRGGRTDGAFFFCLFEMGRQVVRFLSRFIRALKYEVPRTLVLRT